MRATVTRKMGGGDILQGGWWRILGFLMRAVPVKILQPGAWGISGELDSLGR